MVRDDLSDVKISIIRSGGVLKVHGLGEPFPVSRASVEVADRFHLDDPTARERLV